MIMQKQYDNDGACHNKQNGGKLHGNISRNGYGNAIIGRYGGCFEEDIRRFMLEICPRGNNKLVIIIIFPCS